jgi:hypothetical protein
MLLFKKTSVSKEEQFQEGFYANCLWIFWLYTQPAPIQPDYRTQNIKGAVDGAILKDGNALGVIEPKGTNTRPRKHPPTSL